MLVHTHLLMNACVHSNVIPVWLTQDKSFCRLLLKHENETLFSVYTSLSSSFFQVELWWLYIFSFCKFSAEFVLTWGRIYFSLFVLNRINNPSHWRASGKACLPLMITTLAGTHTNMGATNARARARRGGGSFAAVAWQPVCVSCAGAVRPAPWPLWLTTAEGEGGRKEGTQRGWKGGGGQIRAADMSDAQRIVFIVVTQKAVKAGEWYMEKSSVILLFSSIRMGSAQVSRRFGFCF